jgi:DNA-binding MarR family transcriptional regulator
VTYAKDPRVDAYIDALPDWQRAICREVGDLVHSADPEVVETIKYRDRPYFVLGGNVCALLATKDHGDELYARLEEAGYGDLTRLHGAVIAHLDQQGTRATELARRSGRHKQVIGRIVDELEALGYVERRPEERDRRAKLVVPSERGREVMRLSDRIIGEIERRQAEALGKAAYDEFKRTLAAVVDSLTGPPDQER